MKLLLGLTGSAGLMSMTTYLEEFRAAFEDLELKIVVTPAADRIVPKRTWTALGPSGVYGDDNWISAEHVSLSLWPDAILVAPCTANTIASVATGRCDNLLTATITCTHVPVILAANMNALMWGNAAVRRNMRTIREDGHVLVDMEPANAYAFGVRSASQSLGMARPTTLVDTILRATAEKTAEKAEQL